MIQRLDSNMIYGAVMGWVLEEALAGHCLVGNSHARQSKKIRIGSVRAKSVGN